MKHAKCGAIRAIGALRAAWCAAAVLLLPVALASPGASAGAPERTAVVGYLSARESTAPREACLRDLVAGLQQLGWEEGRNLRVVVTYAERHESRLPDRALALLAMRPDVVVAAGLNPVVALRGATSSVPIIAMGTGFLKGAGLIKSLKEPGGNVTGVALGDREHAAKPLDMLQQTLPAARRVGWLRNRNNPAHRRLSREELDAIGSKRGLSLVVAEHGGFDDLEAAWLRLAKGGAQSVYIQPDLGIYTEAHVRLSQRHRLPAITHHLSFARQGGALAYGYTHNFCQRGARYVDRVLRGESPSRMPVEELSDVRFVVNLRTLSHLNLKPSAEALARADELIE